MHSPYQYNSSKRRTHIAAAKVYTENNKTLIHYLYSMQYLKRFHTIQSCVRESVYIREKNTFRKNIMRSHSSACILSYTTEHKIQKNVIMLL